MTRIDCDANGLPLGHEEAAWLAAKELADFVNEWPDHLMHFTPADCEAATSRVVLRYLRAVQRVSAQARVLDLVPK